MSTLPPPDSARLAALDQHFRFGLSAADLEQFAPAVEASLDASTPSSASTGVPPPRRRRSESGSRQPPRSATNSAPGTSPPCLPAHRKAR